MIKSEIQLGVVEAKFADIIWENEPISSSELVKISATELKWKRTTTHTVLRRLCDKGLFQNENGIVSKCISRDDFYSKQSRKYVDTVFNGSLPAFIASFTKDNSISKDDVAKIKKLINDAKEV